MSEAIDEGFIKQIADGLNEENIDMIRLIVSTIGPERTQVFFEKALEIEAQGGLMTSDGSRRRSSGGVFFYTVRGGLPKQEARAIWPPVIKATPIIVALTWEEAKQLTKQALQLIGEAKSVKITLIGRPKKVVQQAECVVISMKGKEPGSLPKGLPTPPAGSAITWAVFIVNKQWNRVKESMRANEDDQLIIEDYPIMDPKSGAGVVLAMNCKSTFMERAQREAQLKAAQP